MKSREAPAVEDDLKAPVKKKTLVYPISYTALVRRLCPAAFRLATTLYVLIYHSIDSGSDWVLSAKGTEAAKVPG